MIVRDTKLIYLVAGGLVPILIEILNRFHILSHPSRMAIHRAA